MSDKNSNGFNRRRFLKTSSMAGIGAYAVQPASAKSATTCGLVEVGVEHSLDFPENLDYGPLYIADDKLPTYRVYNGQLQLTEFASETLKETVRNNDRVVNAASVRSFPAEQVDATKSTKFPAVDTHSDLRPTSCITLDEEYRPPAVGIDQSGDAVSVNVEGEQIDVAPSRRSSVELDSYEASVQVERSQDGTLDRWMEEFTLTPRLIVQNHGELSVTDISNR